MAELFVRPSFNDHEKIADVLTLRPRSIDGAPPPLDRLVLDAHAATRRPQFADAAVRAGIPLLVDPLTFLAQGQLDDDDPWLRLPFVARARAADHTKVDALVDEVLTFELDHGATMIIPPYYYSSHPGDQFGTLNKLLLAATSRWLARASVDLPVVPVLCGQLQKFARAEGRAGVDSLLDGLSELNTDYVALCMSPVGDGTEGIGKLLSLFEIAAQISRRFKVVAWRQGVYGPALVAAGVHGYETGIATREQCNIRSLITSRKKRDRTKESGGGPGYGVFFEGLGRSVSSRVARVLVDDELLRARLMCVDETCCADGYDSTVTDRRGHALRSRARQLHEITRQPERWRLYHIERHAFDAVTLAREGNKLLDKTDLSERIKTAGYESLARAARVLRDRGTSKDVA